MTQTSKGLDKRLLSLDFFRGITMFLLIAEFTHLFADLVVPELKGTFIYSIGMQFHHVKWSGLRFWDLIQPFFTFIVGVAMPMSYSKRLERGDHYNSILKHILIRCFILLVLGWALVCIGSGHVVFQFQNVLAQLSVSIVIAFLVMPKSISFQIIFSLSLLVLSELLYRNFWVTGFDQPFVPDQNFGAWFDLLFSDELSAGHWVSFNAIPTTAHTIWGVLVGKLITTDKTNKEKLRILLIAGIVALLLGYGLSGVTPIIKRIATSTFVLASGGWSLLAFALSYWIIDVLKFNKGVSFFAIVGMNPLFIYVYTHVGGASYMRHIVDPFSRAIFSFLGTDWLSFITNFIALFLLWYVCYFMYKRKIFIKI